MAAETSAPDTGLALLGPLSLDIYRGRDLELPGGGALNMAWHWRQSGTPFELLTRVGDDAPAVFTDFLARHGIPHTPELVAPGRSASIDIVIQPDLQPFMDNFVEGVWATFALTPREERGLARRRAMHVVLVEGAVRELDRLAVAGRLDGLEVTADFLGFRHYTPDRLARTMQTVDVGFVGWPGSPEDAGVGALRAVAHGLARLIVVTFGSQGVWAFDGRSGGAGDAFVPVRAVPVIGTTVGCGDAFIAGFLSAWHPHRDVVGAIEAGKVAGAAATGWRRPLPDEAYGEAGREALRLADAAAAG